MESRYCTDPYPHWIIERFYKPSYCERLALAALDHTGPWVEYNNDCEKKRTLNTFYNAVLLNAFSHLASDFFVSKLKTLTGLDDLQADPDLHGAGIHICDADGYLGRHVDYAINPRSLKKRALNLIVFLSENSCKGGELLLYDGKALAKSIAPERGRAVIWEPTERQGAPLRFHGTAKNGGDEPRITLANYYLSERDTETPLRYEALFAPNRGK